MNYIVQFIEEINVCIQTAEWTGGQLCSSTFH